jgi:hypothetical protein
VEEEDPRSSAIIVAPALHPVSHVPFHPRISEGDLVRFSHTEIHEPPIVELEVGVPAVQLCGASLRARRTQAPVAAHPSQPLVVLLESFFHRDPGAKSTLSDEVDEECTTGDRRSGIPLLDLRPRRQPAQVSPEALEQERVAGDASGPQGGRGLAGSFLSAGVGETWVRQRSVFGTAREGRPG